MVVRWCILDEIISLLLIFPDEKKLSYELTLRCTASTLLTSESRVLGVIDEESRESR